MRQKLRISAVFFALFMIFATKSSGQAEKLYIERIASYVFASDSVSGFDNVAASAGALANGCYGFEYKVFMYKAQRTYIKQKYNLITPSVPLTLFQNQNVARTMAIGGTCDNEDFELASSGPGIVAPGAVQGWTVVSGQNGNSCQPFTPNAFNNYTVYVGSLIDPKIPVPISSYFDAATAVTPAGNCFIKLLQQTSPAGSKAVKLSKSFIVQPTNALFQYAYLPVIEDGPHPCCSQAGFNIRITVTNTTSNQSSVLACPQISIAVPGPACAFTPPPGTPSFSATVGGGWKYHNWNASAIDLTPYLNNLIQIDVVVVDCDAGGHGAYAYFDAKCAPMTLLGNNNPFPAGTPSVTLPTCGAQSATICAPDGLGPYSWAGPGIVAPYNVPLMSNQCLTVGVSADFTLSMNPPGSCQPITRLITVTITPAPYVLASLVQPVCGATNAVVSYTAAGSASINPTIIWNPVPTSTTSNGANLGTATFPAGTGPVTVTAFDPLGCKATATVYINPSPPTPTINLYNVTGSQSITCLTPSVDLAVVSGYTLNPLTYYWASNSFTANTQTITVTNAATLITVTVSDPLTGCQTTATTSIKVNTVVPQMSVNPVNQSINCGPGVVATATGVAISPTTNVSHQWFGPDGVLNPPSGGQVSIYNPGINGSNGTSTLVITDLINGCTASRTVQVVSTGGFYPSFSITSFSTQNTFTLGCGTRSVTDINIVGANTEPPPGGGVVSYTMLPPAYTGTNYATSPTVPSYTANTPGTYTLIVRDNNNLCETRVPIAVIQNTFGPSIFAEATITRTLTCFTPSVNLIGSSNNSSVVYSWRRTMAPQLITNSVLPVSTTTAGASVPSATVIDNYTLTVFDNNNTCTSTSVVTMYQNTRPPKPGIAFSHTALTCVTYSINATNNSTTGVLPGTFFGTGGINAILWQGPTPQEDRANSSTYIGFTPGFYTLTVRDMNNGCTSQTTALLGDNRVYPVITTTNSVPLDCGTLATVKLAAQVVGLNPNQVDAVWDAPVPTPGIQNPNTLTLTTDGIGEYKLTVTTKTNGCVSSTVVNVTNGVLTANFTADQVTGFAPLTVNFTNNSASSSNATATQSITSIWSFGNGTTRTTTVNTTQAGTSAVYTQPGTYTVTMYATKGSCIDTFVKVIRVDIPSKLEVPNVFTPNGDNTNDIFFVRTANLSEISALIFDRWGNKIYELTTEKGNIAWDGKSNTGKEAPDGTYFYIITAKGKDGQNYETKGTVSLYR
ncbi:MAG: gliding motility-associated C-terminal domain-containing protein [Bacteroidota bacterium]